MLISILNISKKNHSKKLTVVLVWRTRKMWSVLFSMLSFYVDRHTSNKLKQTKQHNCISWYQYFKHIFVNAYTGFVHHTKKLLSYKIKYMTLNTCISSNQTKYRQGIRITSAAVIHAYFNTNLHINYQSKYRWFPYFCSIFNWFLI